MTARSSLTIVLAAGEGTRMRSSLPKVLHPVAHQSAARPCARRRTEGNRHLARGRDRPRPSGGRGRGEADPPRRAHLRAARTARHRACGAGGARGDCARRGRSPDRLRRHAADLGRDLCAAARAAREGRRDCRARLSRRRSHRLWPLHRRGRPPGRDPRACRRQRGRAQDRSVQCRRDGDRRPPRARDPRQDRQCEFQGRILSDRCGRRRPRTGMGVRRDRNQRGRSARHQHQGAACGGRRRDAGAACARRRWRPASR